MTLRIYVACLLICYAGCSKVSEESDNKTDNTQNEIAFDQTKWRAKGNDNNYIYRDCMLHDLMSNQHLRELKGDEVLDLLGEPDRIDSLYFFYRLTENRAGFLILHTKTMVIKLSQDSTVDWVKVHQ